MKRNWSVRHFANYFFHVVHVALILFVAFGWIFPAARPLHLVFVCLIFLSWFGLGLFYGIGYCPVTSYHWKLRQSLDLPIKDTYIKYFLDKVFRRNFDSSFVSTVTWGWFLAVSAFNVFYSFVFNS